MAQSTHPPIKATGPQGLRRICWETTEDEERPSGRKSPSPYARLSSYISRQRPLDTSSYMNMRFISCSKRECTLDSAGGRWETLAWLSGPLHVLLWTMFTCAREYRGCIEECLLCTSLTVPQIPHGDETMAAKWPLSRSGIDLPSAPTKELRAVLTNTLPSTESYAPPPNKLPFL